MAKPELIVPFPEALRSVPVATGIRSTTVITSRRGIKERGYFEKYKRSLSAQSEAALEQAVAGVWLPMELGVDHYLACDALGLGLSEQRELGGLALRRLRDTLMGTMAKNLGSAGIVSLWDVLRRYHTFYEANFKGGGSRVWKVGPKDALLEIAGLPLARIPYLRHAYGGLLSEGARFFHPTSHVTEVPRLCGDTSLGFRVAWV
jgi:hypothetical protein